MPAESIEAVKRIYERWSAGRGVQDLIADDIEWVNPQDAIESGTRSGREGFNAAAGNFSSVYPSSTYDIERIEEVGAGEVLAVVMVRAENAASGVAFEMRQGHIWTLRAGKATRFRWFREPGQALEAAGVG